MKQIIIIPSYDSNMKLDVLLSRIRELGTEIDILVVDDGSPTPVSSSVNSVKVLRHKCNMGKGASLINGFKYALATGNWNTKAGVNRKVGVAQVLNRITYSATLSHLRRLNTPIDRSGKLVKPRQLHNTHIGLLCLTGDTTILMDNGMDVQKIENFSKYNTVMSVNRKTLQDEPTRIYNKFGKMSSQKLLKITTITGREIKCTKEHPLLINHEMREAKDLKINDKLTIKNIPEYIENKTDKPVIIFQKKDILNRH